MNGHESIRAAFANEVALFPFLTAGLPTPADSVGLFEAMAEAGADGFEVGIPYSDPLMDGPVIMRGSEVALAAGTTRARALDIVGEVAKRTGKPVLAMTYVNPVMQTGWKEYAETLAERGAAGIIVPDLPLEESCGFGGRLHCYGPRFGPVRLADHDRCQARAGCRRRSRLYIWSVRHGGDGRADDDQPPCGVIERTGASSDRRPPGLRGWHLDP